MVNGVVAKMLEKDCQFAIGVEGLPSAVYCTKTGAVFSGDAEVGQAACFKRRESDVIAQLEAALEEAANHAMKHSGTGDGDYCPSDCYDEVGEWCPGHCDTDIAHVKECWKRFWKEGGPQ